MKKLLLVITLIVIRNLIFAEGKIPTAGQIKYTALKQLLYKCKDCPDDVQLIYDASCKSFYNKDGEVINLNKLTAKYNHKFKVGVVNINRYLYNVEINADDIEFASQSPALFNQLFLGNGLDASDFLGSLMKNISFGTFGLNVESLNDSLTNDITKVLNKDLLKFYKKYFKPEDNFETRVFEFIKHYNELLDNQLKAYKLCPQDIGCCEDDQITYSTLSNELFSLKIEYQKTIEKLTKQTADIGAKLTCIADKKAKMEQLKTEKDTAKIRQLNETIAKLDCNVEEGDTLTKQKTALEKNKGDQEKKWAPLDKISNEELMKLILFTDNLIASNFAYISPPIYPKGNLLDIGIEINPVDSNLLKKLNIAPQDDDSLGIQLFVKKKWYVGFSSGPFVAFGRKNTFNQDSYSWQQQPDTIINGNGIISDSSRYKLAKSGKTTLPVGLAAFANFGLKVTKNVGVGGTVGVGIVIEKNPRPVFFLGASLFLGSDWHQFNISLGAALVQIKDKSGLYQDNVLYSTKPAEIEYSKKTVVSGFISVSYTLFSSVNTRKATSKSKK